jgi:hypothetical protein
VLADGEVDMGLEVARVVGVHLGRELVVDLGLDRVGMH